MYDAELAAKSLARKLDLDAESMQASTDSTRSCLIFAAKPLLRLPDGGSVDQMFAAILEQAPCPEDQPPQGSQGVEPEVFRKSDALWELESSIKDLARQSEVEYRARYYAGAVGFLRGLHMMRVVDAEERNRWKVKILEAHLQAIAQCEAAGEVVPEEIKRREAFELENLRRMERVTEALQGKEDV
ncbi:hypothetical protein D3C78_1346360 [compost metagenome]